MNIGSFIASEKETYGIFFDNYAQSVTDDFKNKYNPELVEILKMSSYPELQSFLITAIEDYCKKTQSNWGKEILNNFENCANKFLMVKPKTIKIEELLKKDSVAA